MQTLSQRVAMDAQQFRRAVTITQLREPDQHRTTQLIGTTPEGGHHRMRDFRINGGDHGIRRQDRRHGVETDDTTARSSLAQLAGGSRVRSRRAPMRVDQHFGPAGRDQRLPLRLMDSTPVARVGDTHPDPIGDGQGFGHAAVRVRRSDDPQGGIDLPEDSVDGSATGSPNR